MKTTWKIEVPAFLWIFTAVTLFGGCCGWEKRTPTPPLGIQSDAIWRRQAAGASASDFVIYQNEFVKNEIRLNTAGEDHLRSIAARLHCGAPVPVIVERSTTHIRPDTKHHYPIHPDPELDRRRREHIVALLIAMGIPNADQCTVVAPAMAEGFTAEEAAHAFNQGLMSGNGNNRSGNNGGGMNGGNPVNKGIGASGTIDSQGNYSDPVTSL
jgi:hypothetical protein